jgi:pre-rRNA-processing protein TSR3
VVHPKENRKKCSLEPLRGRPDLSFVTFSAKRSMQLTEGYVRLSVDGPPLTPADAERGILLIDGSWRHAARMHAHFAAVPPRSLPGYRTAYPRVSKVFEDPPEGLASVEALYVAYRMLGRPTEGLLDGYRWRDRFLELNRLEG